MNKIISLLTVTALTASLLTGCSSTATTTATTTDTTGDTATVATAAAQVLSSSQTAEDVLTLTTDDAFNASDYEVGYIASTTTSITLSDSGSTVEGGGATVSGSTITITAGGTYLISGGLTDGQIVVDCEEDEVQLMLDGVSIANSTSAPIYIVAADQTYITTASGSDNELTAILVEDDSAETNIDAVIFSHDDITLNGGGTLTIIATDGNGITSKDDLIITSGSYIISADKHGLEANDSIRIAGGTFQIFAQKDGLHCENEDEADKGYIYIVGGTFTIDALGDGIDSSSQVQIENGTFDITAGGGYDTTTTTTSSNIQSGMTNSRDQMGTMPEMSGEMAVMPEMNGEMGVMPEMNGEMGTMPEMSGQMTGQMSGQMGRMSSTDSSQASLQLLAGGGGQMPGQMSGQMGTMPGMTTTTTTTAEDDSLSTKGIKAGTYIILNGGDFIIDALDDALHANQSLEIWAGTYQIQCGDDAIHAEYDTFIGGGTITITSCYEGIEGERIEIAGGTINIKSNDDGLNATRGTSSSGDIDILISGGYLFIDCDYEGDGIDSNGTILVTGGTVVIYGTTTTTDTTLDYGSSSAITGGTFIATGSAGQTLQNFGEDSTQGSILVQLSSFTTGDVILTDSSGNVIAQTTPTKSYQAVIISTPDIVVGETYTLTAGDYTETIVMDSLIYGEGNEHSMGGMTGGMSNMQGGMSGGMGGR